MRVVKSVVWPRKIDPRDAAGVIDAAVEEALMNVRQEHVNQPVEPLSVTTTVMPPDSLLVVTVVAEVSSIEDFRRAQGGG